MGPLIDVLHVGSDKITAIRDMFPDCQVTKFHYAKQTVQQYQVKIPGELEECYYNFLFENEIAMSSNALYYRVKSDKLFADRIKARLAGPVARP